MGKSSVPDLFRGAVQDLRIRPRGNVPTLDVLRSIAILVVFSGHYAFEFEGVHWVQRLPMFFWGWTGVDLFFVLSGYLIGTQLWKEVKRANGIRIGRFLLRRGLRIWPLYYAFVGFVGFEGLLGRNISGLWSDACFLSNYFHCQIGGGWSLSTEEQFYILAPVSIALFSLILKPRRLWIVPVGGLLVLLMNRAIVIHYSTLSITDLRQKLYLPMATHADGLAIGLLLAWVGVFYPELIKSNRFRYATCGAMVVLGIVLYAINQVQFNFTSLGLIFGAMALWGIGLEKTPQLLNWHGFYIVSRLSYGMYLNHFGLLGRLRDLLLPLRHRGGEAAFWILYIVSILASLAIAFITFQLIEWPFLQIRARWLASEKKPQPQPASEAATA
jgi:peptidoglycan/LPS O-acetylase OafA/YrhL